MIFIEKEKIELAYELAKEGKSLTHISKVTGITRRTLADRLYRDYGFLNSRTKKLLEQSLLKFEEIDKEAYLLYLEGHSLSEISKTLNIGRDSLSKRLYYRHNITFENNRQINVDYFKTINHESAYWLGYIQGDGCVSNEIFEITSKDKKHIELLKKCLSSEHKISEKNVNGETYWRFSVARADFVQTLIEIGISPRKSYVDTKFKIVDDEYIYSYLLGFFDADGSVIYKTSKNIMIGFTVSRHNKQFKDEMLDFLINTGMSPRIYELENRPFEIRLNVEDSKKLVNLMYENSKIYLDRKHKKCQVVLPS